MKTQIYTHADWEAGTEIPIDLQGWISDRSDGMMLDDNWNDYIDLYLGRVFEHSTDPVIYEVQT